MAFDPILLVALALGALLGRVLPAREPWPGRVTAVIVCALLLALGTSLGTSSDASLLAALPIGAAIAAITFGLTALAAILLRRREAVLPSRTTPAARAPWSGALYASALVAGFGIERTAHLSLSGTIEPLLWVLVAVVAYGLRWNGQRLRRWWAPLLAAVIGATASAGLAIVLFNLPPAVSLATTYAFGFYSLAGPLVGARFGAALGFVAFLANFLRENAVMVTSPAIGPRLQGEGLAALGGATSMDTTLFFITRYGDLEAGGPAHTTGLVLTVLASVLLPILTALPGA